MAKKLEKDLGVPVLRHTEKKPAGGPEDLEKHFGWVLLRRRCRWPGGCCILRLPLPRCIVATGVLRNAVAGRRNWSWWATAT